MSYSLEETPTGFNWIDGKPIFQRSINPLSLPNAVNVWQDFGHGIDIDQIVGFSATAAASDRDYQRYFQHFNAIGGFAHYGIEFTTSDIRINTMNANLITAGWSGVATLWYTKR